MFGWMYTARPEECEGCGKLRHLRASTRLCALCTAAAEVARRQRIRRELDGCE